MIEKNAEPESLPQASENNGAKPKSTNVADPYIPYQPALDVGISEEMDRVNFRRLQLAEREARDQLSPEEKAEFNELQDKFFAYIETIFPRSWVLDDDRLEKLEQKYNIKKS